MIRGIKPPEPLRGEGVTTIDDIVREMEKYSAIDVALGACQGELATAVKQAGMEAMSGDRHQYADSKGIQPLREAIADDLLRRKGLAVNPDTEITVTSGAIEGLTATVSAVVRPGDEVIVLEPYFEQYAAMVRLCGATLRPVRLEWPTLELDERRLAAAFNNRTAAVILNDPNNPTGKVFTTEELHTVARYCERFGAVCIADEVYQDFVYDGRRHVSIAKLDGMRERTVLVSSLSKTYQASGWRIGFAVAPERISIAIRARHELFSGGAPTPLQVAAIQAFRMPDAFYSDMRRDYQRRRDYLSDALSTLGFSHQTPPGGFYVFTDASGLGVADAEAFVIQMMKQAGVACVPGRCFYSDPGPGRTLVRFCFAKTSATLEAASRALSRWLGHEPAHVVQASRTPASV
jgi:aspartate/methionine/tyrosine aminotransferase